VEVLLVVDALRGSSIPENLCFFFVLVDVLVEELSNCFKFCKAGPKMRRERVMIVLIFWTFFKLGLV